ncbi:MAG: type IV pilus assembly protein PilM [Armatimonadota bacterium]|nr:type IV pilus assembly protein PilM [bacterium]
MLGHQKTKGFPNRVGLDIGNHTVNGVEVVEHGSELTIRSAGAAAIPGLKSRQDTPDQSATLHAIRNLWSSARFTSKKVVLALPPQAVYIKWLHLEAQDETELENTARATAARGAPFSADDAVVDFRILSARGLKTRNVYFTMLVAASGSYIDDMLNIVESAGLDPVAVDIGVAAALRSQQSQHNTASHLWSGQPKAHCIMGAKTTTIAVMRGNALEFARTVPVGGNDFTEAIIEHANVTWAEAEKIKTSPDARLTSGSVLVATTSSGELRIPCDNVVGRLAREIQRSLKFFSSQFAEGSYLGMIGAVTASGGAALMKGIDTCLQEQGIELARIVNPFTGFSVAAEAGGMQHISGSAAAYTTSMGLAATNYWEESEMSAAA